MQRGRVKLRVLVFYGGDAATHPRDELLAWLRGPHVGIDARTVAEGIPHSSGSVDDRVDQAIAEADAAIAILTPDARSPHGAPNVMDEIGRWRGGKSKATLLMLRQENVQPYSNHAGIVYAAFDRRISEVFEDVRRFLSSLSPTEASAPTAAAGSSFVVESSGAAIMIGSHFFQNVTITENGSDVTVSLEGLSDRSVSNLTGLASNAPLTVAYANTAIRASLRRREVRRLPSGGSAELEFHDTRQGEYGGSILEMAWGGSPRLSADEIATLRTSRVLFNDPVASADQLGIETLIRGGGGDSLAVNESVLARFLATLPQDDILTWQLARLVLIAQLRLSDCVEHVDSLRLTVDAGQLRRIEFDGRRRRRYDNQDPHRIVLDRRL